MEVAGLAFSVAQTLLAALQCSEIKDLFATFGYKDELARLQSTVGTIKAVLLDAQVKTELSHQEKNIIEKLKYAVYDADDLFDEFTTLAEHHQHKEGAKVPKKARRLFSRLRNLDVAYRMSKEVKKIRKDLEGIANDASNLCFKVDYRPIRSRRDDSSSYVHMEYVVGRENEKEDIIKILLDPTNNVVQDRVSFLTVVGMGGLGKTSLARLVYNDQRIVDGFQLRLWACLSDHDQRHLDVGVALSQILESVTGQKHDGSRIEPLQRQIREHLQGKKYLLVIDDVWTENRGEWLRLAEFLMESCTGSWIVVTTRSKLTALAVGSNYTYELGGLSEENSWRLFKLMAGQEQANSQELVEIGRAIVKNCANVPLAIKVVGALLYGQGEDKWRSFQKSRITEIRNGENGILPILKFSYHHLSPSLKSCFTYCSLFPKDFRMEKEMLISLWMAQGFVERLDGGQSIEDAGEEHFQILLRRCFFQDVQKNLYGEVVSCKIHDLMHDIAQEVAGMEICDANVTTRGLDEKTRHIFVSQDCKENLFTNTKIRSYLCKPWFTESFPWRALVPNLMYLRALDLRCLNIRILPDTIGELLHLRYLDLSGNRYLEILPTSITKLYNLQTLRLRGCEGLKELPNDFSLLVKLRALDIENCDSLTCMPCGMSKLTHLSRLTLFVVGGAASNMRRPIAGIEELTPLKNLRGRLEINIDKDYTYFKEKRVNEGYLSNKEHLTDIHIFLNSFGEGRLGEEEQLLEDLQPHSKLKKLEMVGYRGVRLPKWARQDNLSTYLPNLVKIKLNKFCGLRELPRLGKLHCLRYMEIKKLDNLEYMESSSCSSCVHGAVAAGSTSGGSNTRPSPTAAEIDSRFFPCLEELVLWDLPKLKGWWRETMPGGSHSLVLPSFPRLSKLFIRRCPNLTLMPLCRPTVEVLDIGTCNERLRLMAPDEEVEEGSCSEMRGLLRSVRVDDVEHLKSLPPRDFPCLSKMTIEWENKVESLSEIGEVLRSCSSSLRKLCISKCSKLRRVWGGGLEHLIALEVLTLCDLPELKWNEEEEEEEDDDDDDLQKQSWICFPPNLRDLSLLHLPKVEKLPKGMRHLTSLQDLYIYHCPKVESIPHWIGCLSSLRLLQFSGCEQLKSLPESMRELNSLKELYLIDCSEELKERCREPDGECWPFIQHIPYIGFEFS